MAQWIGPRTTDPKVWGSKPSHDQTFINTAGSQKPSVIAFVGITKCSHIEKKDLDKHCFSGCVYTGPAEYLVGQIFGHLGLAFTRGRLNNLKLGHLGVQIFGHLGKRPS